MMSSKKGSLTIFLALCMMTFLMFCLVLTEGVRFYYLRAKAETAMDLAGFSVLSEYQKELLSHYGVFFVDLDYEQGTEQTSILEQRFQTYLSKNAEEIETKSLLTSKFRRATDQDGLPFLKQAAEFMKVKSGYKVLEELTGIEDSLGEAVDLGSLLEEQSGAAASVLKGYVDEEGNSLFSISLPNVSFPSVNALTEAVFGSESMLSEKSVNLQERLLNRSLKSGDGRKEERDFADAQFFYGYLFEHFSHYGARDKAILASALEYQLEYIIAGEESDLKNLENIMWRIFLMRAGGNYALFHSDAGRLAQAEAEATALVGITGNAALIGMVREILLIGQAIEEGIKETKSIFAGASMPVYQNEAGKSISMGYEQYLYLFLMTTGQKQKVYRAMDLIELEVREKSGYQNFRMDHCVDAFVVEWHWQTDAILNDLPYGGDGTFENVIRRNIFYEM